jgi:citronellol/citronellal dehydrogenase
MPSILRPGLFAGHVTVVTGGGSGIGLAIARTLCELGAKVAICGRNEDKLQRARAELARRGWTAHAAKCDIREPDHVASFVTGTRAALGETRGVDMGRELVSPRTLTPADGMPSSATT